MAEGGVFFRNASGALMLAYVAAGRLLGYVEEHMNAWDCLAGMLLVEEAGGTVLKPDPKTVLQDGTLVITGGKGRLFETAGALFGGVQALNAICVTDTRSVGTQASFASSFMKVAISLAESGASVSSGDLARQRDQALDRVAALRRSD